VPSAQITAIVGPAGCGKTTLLRLVNRMIEPTSGKITWDGNPLRAKRKTALRRQMGYFTADGLFPHRTVLDNIGTVPGLLGWNRAKADKRALELLNTVGLERSLGHRYPAELTPAQQLRVGLARAIAGDPKVVLLDEPFATLNPVERGESYAVLTSLQRNLGTTIILVTDDIDEALQLGDQIAVLTAGGKLAQVGSPQQLLDEPADAFVAGFLGRDRGYRSLSYLSAGGLTLDRVQVVRDPESAGHEPTLVVDADARPVGWVDQTHPGQVFPLGATFSPDHDSLRVALDSALTSPFGLAVGVDATTGRFAGVVSAKTILGEAADARIANPVRTDIPTMTEIPTEDGSTIETDLPSETPPLPEGEAPDDAADDPEETTTSDSVDSHSSVALERTPEEQHARDEEFEIERQLEDADSRR
ncbi:MAG TPA: ATP-binding cassette domain-containing protein, partial [Propionibacteriaceae bacterium]